MSASSISFDLSRFRARYLPDIGLGFQNLLLHKLRSLLTMLGMIFGVAAVIAMLSIGAGARQQAMAFIEQLGVRNLIVEAHEASSWQDWQEVRKTSPGLTLQDYRGGIPSSNPQEPHRGWKVAIPAVTPGVDIELIWNIQRSYTSAGGKSAGSVYVNEQAPAEFQDMARYTTPAGLNLIMR